MATLHQDFAAQQHADRIDYLLPKTDSNVLVDVCTLTEQQENALEQNPQTASRGTAIAHEMRYEDAVKLASRTSRNDKKAYLQVVFYKPNTRTVIESC